AAPPAAPPPRAAPPRHGRLRRSPPPAPSRRPRPADRAAAPAAPCRETDTAAWRYSAPQAAGLRPRGTGGASRLPRRARARRAVARRPAAATAPTRHPPARQPRRSLSSSSAWTRSGLSSSTGRSGSSPSFFIRAGAVLIVNFLMSSFGVTSLHLRGIDTGAPGRGRTLYG